MPRLVPDPLPPTAPSSERRMHEAFKALPDDWVVIRSFRSTLPASAGQLAWEGETDFVLVAPDGRIGCIEVKGGGVSVWGRALGIDRFRGSHARDQGSIAPGSGLLASLFRYLIDHPLIRKDRGWLGCS